MSASEGTQCTGCHREREDVMENQGQTRATAPPDAVKFSLGGVGR